MTQELNKELEELLDAELTEEELKQIDEVEEVGGVAKMKSPTAKAKALKSGGGDKSELSDESEDLGPAVTSPEDKDSGIGKSADKAKKAKPTNPAKSEPKVSQGNSAQATPGEKLKLAAGDDIDHDGEVLGEWSAKYQIFFKSDSGKGNVEGTLKGKAKDAKAAEKEANKMLEKEADNVEKDKKLIKKHGTIEVDDAYLGDLKMSYDPEGEVLEEARMTKAKMLEDLTKALEGLSSMKSTDLKGVYERVNAAIKTDAEIEEGKKDKELEELEAAKKEIEEKIKNISVKEDVEALIQGEDDLSEEFKDKAATIFEAAVKTKVRDEIEKIETEYAEKLTEAVAEHATETSEKVDAYLNYVVEEWMKNNEVAIEQKLKTDITENFITALKGLFEEHNITVPDEKYDILDAAAKQADEMEAKLNEQIESNVALSQKVAKMEKDEILVDVASDLADTEVEKFVGLAESVEFEDSDDFKKKLQTIKESYFPRHAFSKDDEAEAAPVYNEQGDLSGSMAAYMTAISKTEKFGRALDKPTVQR